MPDLNKQLRRAARTGDLATVQFCLAAGADVQADDNAPLRMAAKNGHLAVVQCLLAAGADVNASEGYALAWAAAEGHLAVVQALTLFGAEVNAGEGCALILAAEHDHPTVVGFLLQNGAALLPIMEDLCDRSPAVQVAALTHGDVGDLSLTDLARAGVCQAALYALMDRLGYGDLVILLSATQILDPLDPDGRAEMLAGMLTQHQPVRVSAKP